MKEQKIKHGGKNETSWKIGYHILNGTTILVLRRKHQETSRKNIKKNARTKKIKHSGKNATSWKIPYHILNWTTIVVKKNERKMKELKKLNTVELKKLNTVEFSRKMKELKN